MSVVLLMDAYCYETIGQLDRARSLYEEANKLGSTQWPQGHLAVATSKTLVAIPELDTACSRQKLI